MSIRTEKLASVLKEDLGHIIREYQTDNMLTITTVKMSPDLSIAKIYVSVYTENGDEDETFEYLESKSQEIRGKLASLIKNQVRRIPELHFYRDDTSEYVNRIESLFQKIKSSEDDRDKK